MKVGIIFAIYNCEGFVDKCLEPWLKLRESHNLILTCTSGQFKPYQDLGIKNKNQTTISQLVTKELDFIATTAGNNLLEEDASRDLCLNYLKPHKCDIIWLVDGDEFYTEKQIKDILHFVEETPDQDAFSVYFKNYTTSKPYFTEPWSRPTLYRNRLYGGIKRFYFDAFFDFEDDIHSVDDLYMFQIPKYIAFVEHDSWTFREATIDKIKYQKVRYEKWWHKIRKRWIYWPEESRCMCEHVDGKIYLSEIFYQIRDSVMPALHSYPNNDIIDHIHFHYNRKKNKLIMRTEKEFKDYTIKLKDLTNETVYFDQPLNLGKGYDLWFIPPNDVSSKDFSGYKVEILKDNKVLHTENIHTNVGILRNASPEGEQKRLEYHKHLWS